MTIDEVVRILNQSSSSRKYSKEEAKELYEFLKTIAESQVTSRLKKTTNGE
jgi:hypothetical protein